MANATKQLRSKIRPPYESTFQWGASLQRETEGLQFTQDVKKLLSLCSSYEEGRL